MQEGQGKCRRQKFGLPRLPLDKSSPDAHSRSALFDASACAGPACISVHAVPSPGGLEENKQHVIVCTSGKRGCLAMLASSNTERRLARAQVQDMLASAWHAAPNLGKLDRPVPLNPNP